MPELPEVETTRRGIEPWLVGCRIRRVIVRDRRLRWPVPTTIARKLKNQSVNYVNRRAKYLLVEVPNGTLILHLGMSGSLRIVDSDSPADKHDHFELELDSGHSLRLRDPRRFGAALWTDDDPLMHPLLVDLGPEPLGNNFDGTWLFEHSRGRKVTVKQFIMDAHVVAGVGNIYASEALFLASIHPKRAAGRIAARRYESLAAAIKEVLGDAITQGGTTLRDFVNEEGQPGYFSQRLSVYGRADEACDRCGQPIKQSVLGQRSTFYCTTCQR